MSNDLTIVAGFDEGYRKILKEMYFKGSSDSEFEAFIMLCKKSNLDPISKQIYAMKVGGKVVTIVSIDGFRLIAERTRNYSPGREPTYTYDKNGKLFSATAYVKKLTSDGTWHEVAATALLCEFEKKGNNIWTQMPHVMLAKCAECQALRRAFPNDLSGLYSKEELEQADVQEIKNREPKLLTRPAETVNATAEVVSDAPTTIGILRTIDDLMQACVDTGLKVDKPTLVMYVLKLRDNKNAKGGKQVTDQDIVQSVFLPGQLERFCQMLLDYMAEPIDPLQASEEPLSDE